MSGRIARGKLVKPVKPVKPVKLVKPVKPVKPVMNRSGRSAGAVRACVRAWGVVPPRGRGMRLTLVESRWSNWKTVELVKPVKLVKSFRRVDGCRGGDGDGGVVPFWQVA